MDTTFNVIIQARMTSTRLPGKVLKQVLGKPLLEYQIERIHDARLVNKIIIATTENTQDSEIIQFCDRMNLDYFRGSELNVLSRYLGASQKYPSSHVIRITSDCPVIDPRVIDRCIEQFTQAGWDYASNSEDYPNGMNVEIFAQKLFFELAPKALLPYEQEHVTPYFYTHPDEFKLGQFRSEKVYEKHRLTVDTQEDFELIKFVIEKLYPQNKDFTLDDICRLLNESPDMAQINRHVRQKKYNETQ
jgi:spore coat polysaccharide biosynthesis protein SpsF